MLDVRNFGEPRHQLSARLRLHFSGSARLIPMIVIDDDDFDVGQLKAQTFDVFLQVSRRLRIHRPHQDVALRRRQQVSLAVQIADEVKIADDLVRFCRYRVIRNALADFQCCGDELLAQPRLLGCKRRVRRKGLRLNQRGRARQKSQHEKSSLHRLLIFQDLSSGRQA